MEEPFLRRPREQHQRLRRRRLRDGLSRSVVNDAVPGDIGLVILDSRGFERIKYFWVAPLLLFAHSENLSGALPVEPSHLGSGFRPPSYHPRKRGVYRHLYMAGQFLAALSQRALKTRSRTGPIC